MNERAEWREKMKERADEGNKEVSSEEEERIVEEECEEEMREAALSAISIRTPTPSKQIVPKTPEAVDDFLRNFLRRAGLNQTLNVFEPEWYGSAQKLLSETLRTSWTGVFIPDALTHRQLLQRELETVRMETDRLRRDVLVAGESLVRTQRERDFHRLQHRRVAEEKNRLIKDFKQLKKHLESYEPVLRQLEDKYQAALREKSLITLEKDRVRNATDARLNEEKSQNLKESSIKRSDGGNTSPTKTRHPKDTEFPVRSRLVNPPLAQGTFNKWKSTFSLSFSFGAHKLPISCIDLHPQKLILATASDDRSWRLWELLPNEEKVGQMLTGEGHSDWLSGCCFHPDGAKLATTSGDCTVRLWDFSLGRCVLPLAGHSQPTWGCSFHCCGHFLASCSADRTAKVWDLNSQRCRLTLRRHTASVNSVCFLPLSNLLLTASADKTLATWDARLGVCTASFDGHQHPCNHAAFSPAADAVVASCDTRGIVHLWDVRKPAFPTATVDAGPLAANQVAFSPSGKTLAVAGSDGVVRVVQVDNGVTSSLSGSGDGVQSVTFDHEGETVMSAGRDGVISVWAGK
ncbi:sperm-associated antigen 16 protein [Pungitius pungitius]|uniref:sperm-associated antigen 16 protein n=1 Tax=Pungitius pungitius TaxID=134920 RepID=UPI002E15E9C6